MNHPIILNKVERVREWRSKSNRKNTKELADTPTLFAEIRQPHSKYLAIPTVCSGRRKFIPIQYYEPNVIASNQIYVVPNASIYHFGILTSSVHMAWTRVVGGRLKSDYRYAAKIVYNNFPWCSPTPEQKAAIEESAQAILDARAKYPNSSLADMYGEQMYLYPELLKAHQENDKAVMKAYGFTKVGEDGKNHWLTESEVVAELMKMYQELTTN